MEVEAVLYADDCVAQRLGLENLKTRERTEVPRTVIVVTQGRKEGQFEGMEIVGNHW